MNILQDLSFNQMVIVTLGILVDVYAIMLIKTDFKSKSLKGKVVESTLQSRKDDQGDWIQYFYKTEIRCQGTTPIKLDSGRQYHKGDTVMLRAQNGVYSFDRNMMSRFGQIMLLVMGVLLVMIPIVQTYVSFQLASKVFGLLLLIAAIALLHVHFKEKQLEIIKVSMTVKEVLKVSNGKSNSRFIKEQVSYHPILNGRINDKFVDVIGPMSSSLKTAYKIGDVIDMEYCKELDIFKKHIQTKGLLVLGILLACIGIFGILN